METASDSLRAQYIALTLASSGAWESLAQHYADNAKLLFGVMYDILLYAPETLNPRDYIKVVKSVAGYEPIGPVEVSPMVCWIQTPPISALDDSQIRAVMQQITLRSYTLSEYLDLRVRQIDSAAGLLSYELELFMAFPEERSDWRLGILRPLSILKNCGIHRNLEFMEELDIEHALAISIGGSTDDDLEQVLQDVLIPWAKYRKVLVETCTALGRRMANSTAINLHKVLRILSTMIQADLTEGQKEEIATGAMLACYKKPLNADGRDHTAERQTIVAILQNTYQASRGSTPNLDTLTFSTFDEFDKALQTHNSALHTLITPSAASIAILHRFIDGSTLFGNMQDSVLIRFASPELQKAKLRELLAVRKTNVHLKNTRQRLLDQDILSHVTTNEIEIAILQSLLLDGQSDLARRIYVTTSPRPLPAHAIEAVILTTFTELFDNAKALSRKEINPALQTLSIIHPKHTNREIREKQLMLDAMIELSSFQGLQNVSPTIICKYNSDEIMNLFSQVLQQPGNYKRHFRLLGLYQNLCLSLHNKTNETEFRELVINAALSFDDLHYALKIVNEVKDETNESPGLDISEPTDSWRLIYQVCRYPTEELEILEQQLELLSEGVGTCPSNRVHQLLALFRKLENSINDGRRTSYPEPEVTSKYAVTNSSDFAPQASSRSQKIEMPQWRLFEAAQAATRTAREYLPRNEQAGAEGEGRVRKRDQLAGLVGSGVGAMESKFTSGLGWIRWAIWRGHTCRTRNEHPTLGQHANSSSVIHPTRPLLVLASRVHLLGVAVDLKAQGANKYARQVPAGSGSANYDPLYQRHNNPFSRAPEDAAQRSTVNSLPMSKQGSLHGSVDSFGGLVDFGASRKADLNKMTLAQQAAALQARKTLQADQSNLHFSHAAFFEQQLSRPPSTGPGFVANRHQDDLYTISSLKKSMTETSEELLAQINGHAPVDKSSFYPPPASPTRMPEPKQPFTTQSYASSGQELPLSSAQDEMLDFFGFDSNQKQTNGHQSPISGDHDANDILGDLGRPITTQASPYSKVEGKPIPYPSAQSRKEFIQSSSSSSSDDSSDDDELRQAKAESLRAHHPQQSQKGTEDDPRAPFVAQIMDMGYTARQAQAALAQTDTGLDVAAAIELLLMLDSGIARDEMARNRTPPVQRAQGRPGQVQDESGDWVDTTYDLASKTLASANNWFSNKSALARRKLAEFNANTAAETHASRFDERPKWMRDAERYERKDKGKGKASEEADDGLREEGLPMHPSERKRLEENGVLPKASRRGSVDSARSAKSLTGSIKSIPESLRSIGATVTGQQQAAVAVGSATATDPRRFKANDDDSATYVSSRRRRPESKVDPSTSGASSGLAYTAASSSSKGKTKAAEHIDEEEEDLFGTATASSYKGKGKAQDLHANAEYDKGKVSMDEEEVDLFSAPKAVRKQPPAMTADARPKSLPTRKARALRQLPYLDTTVLATSSQHRMRGTEAFKRGDFSKALTCYQSSLTSIPDSHTIRILSLTNLAITQIQLGAPKPATESCDEALKLIGTDNGTGEAIDDAGRMIPMTSLWSKAMTRKATALEMQERSEDALRVWQELVESGLGGPQAIEARQRCQKLLLPKVKTAPRKVAAVVSGPSQASRAAVQKLRDDDKRVASDEAQKDALYAVVNDRITTWSTGKEQNLRALLGSLDQVLWAASGWKKVTLADLVVDAKVKVIYMKALAKVHPDKISRDASIEEKMIAAGVFSKLNGAWDSFKSQNNM